MDQDFQREVYQEYQLGDMLARYLKLGTGQMELQLIPVKMRQLVKKPKGIRGDSLVQIKLVGDAYPGAYAGGVTLRNSETVERCYFTEQKYEQQDDTTSIKTYLQDGRGHLLIHELSWRKGEVSVASQTTFVNQSSQRADIELLSSFSLSEMTPFQDGDGKELVLHRILSKWSQEGRLKSERLEDLLMESNWSKWQPNAVRYGQIGSMPAKSYFPFIALEDQEAHVTWGAQLAIEGSWQMEIYRRDASVTLSGGQADREFGQWLKYVEPGEQFTSPKAILTVCVGDVDYAAQRLTQAGEKYLQNGPEVEQDLPILFNEYCTTWGLPSHENISSIVEAIKGKGIDYFVMDCGWFVEEGKHWGNGMGDYVPSQKLFPKGIRYTLDCIKAAGMKPGIWFEIDNVGRDAHVYQNEDLLLKRDGHVLTTLNRRFFDMRKSETKTYLTEKVIHQLKDFGAEYMKMDYNDTIGLGCDGAESIGEGLRQNMEASVAFVKKVKEEIPDIILENCASGGHKLEPLMMSLCSMASFSDAHECEEIPVIAAQLHRTILPRQSQIWAVIRKDASLKRIAYILCSTFLGRMCLSGDVTQLSQEQWKVIDQGMAFYKEIAPIIKEGYTYIDSHKGISDRELTGYQAVIRVQRDNHVIENGLELYEGKHEKAYVVVHQFNKPLESDALPKVIEIKLPKDCPTHISKIFAGTLVQAEVKKNILYVYPTEEMEAVGILLD